MKAILFTLSTFYIVNSYGVEISSSDGDSMDPNIRSGDILIIDKFFYRYLPTSAVNNKLNLVKGDIIVATQPTNPRVKICKRIL
jgi:signal peptidase I